MCDTCIMMYSGRIGMNTACNGDCILYRFGLLATGKLSWRSQIKRKTAFSTVEGHF